MKEERPWGWYEVIDQGDRFKVKNIEVKPGSSLSLQQHYHRTEHWVVVSGTALVQLNNDEQLLGENQSTYTPPVRIFREPVYELPYADDGLRLIEGNT